MLICSTLCIGALTWSMLFQVRKRHWEGYCILHSSIQGESSCLMFYLEEDIFISNLNCQLSKRKSCYCHVISNMYTSQYHQMTNTICLWHSCQYIWYGRIHTSNDHMLLLCVPHVKAKVKEPLMSASGFTPFTNYDDHHWCVSLKLTMLHQFWLSGKEVETIQCQVVQDKWRQEGGPGEAKGGSRTVRIRARGKCQSCVDVHIPDSL